MKYKITFLAIAQCLTAIGWSQTSVPTLDAQMKAIQMEKASRSPVQRKLRSQLHYLSVEAAGKSAVQGVPEFKSRVKLLQDGRVTVDIAAVPSPALGKAITDAGGTVVYESSRWNSVRAVVPPRALAALAAREDVGRIEKGETAQTHTVTNEADIAMKANTARPFYGATGAGIKVGVLSDSEDKSEASIAAGELPVGIWSVLPGRTGRPASGEGTAMSEIVHDIAPAAQIIFAAAGPGKAGFGDAIIALKDAGCKVLVDDISYGNEWQFQDDEIGQAINTVVAAGCVYLSSSGNEGSLKRGTSTTWEGDFVDGGAANAPLPSGGRVHSFGTQNFNRLVAGDSGVTLQWSDENHSASNEYDLYILNAAGTSVVTASTDVEDGTEAAYESVEGVHPGERIVVWKKDAAAARYLRLSCTGSKIEIQTAGQTIGHAATANCICVASADVMAAAPVPFTAATPVEDSSSDGPHKMFYQPNGTPITPGNFLSSGGVTLITPAITAGDGGNTSVPGFIPFYGTSAAAPAAAAVAALVWSRTPSLTNAQVRAILESSCLDIEGPGVEINSGHGILLADLALTQTRTPQEIWRQTNFSVVLPAGNSAPSADPDQDGVINLLEYALGTNPNLPSGSPLQAIRLSGAGYVLNYRRNPAATDVSVFFEHNPNLGANGWLSLVPTADTVISTSAGVDLRSVTLGASGTRDFFRIKVTSP